MSDERPVSFRKRETRRCAKKRLHEADIRICIVHFKDIHEKNVSKLTEHSKAQILRYYNLQVAGQTKPIFSDVLSNFPKELNDHVHGHHKQCYRRFTNVRIKFQHVDESHQDEGPEPPVSKKRRQSQSSKASTVLLPDDTCIICDKKGKKLHGSTKREKLVKCETKAAEKSIKEYALSRNVVDVIGRVQYLDLVAREAHYHETCRRDLVRDVGRHAQRDKTPTAMKAAYGEAFNSICEYVEESVIAQAQVERLTMLHERFLAIMQEKHPEFYNPNYRTQKLKQKLTDHFGAKIQFCLI